MTTTYSAQIDTIQTIPQAPPGTPFVSGDVYNQLRGAVIAIENELGVKPSGTNNTVRARMDILQGIITNFQGVNLGGDLGHNPGVPFVIGIQGRPVSSIAPQLNQLLIWNGIAWVPESIIFSGDVIGNFATQTVTGLQGRPVSNAQPSLGQLLEWNGSAWAPTNEVFAGDITGNFSNQTVIRINGATVPAAGALTIGNVLQVSGNSAVTYAPVNLAGGSNYVVGALPVANQVSQNVFGDVTGTTASTTVTALQGFAVKNQVPTSGQVLTWISGDAKWEPTAIPVQFTPGGDLTGTGTSQTVSFIQGLQTSLGSSAAVNEAAIVYYNPLWQDPLDIAFDGTNLWVVSPNDTFITKIVPGYSSHTTYSLPASHKARTVVANSTYVFAAGNVAPDNNRLYVFNASTGALVGLGQYPSAATPIDIALDDTGNVWTVDGVNLQGFNIATMVANGPGTPTPPTKTLAISGCGAITFGVTTGGHHYLFVANGTGHQISSVNPATPAIVLTYSDTRTFGHLFFSTSGVATSALYATTGGDNHVVRINPDTMTQTANILNGGTASSVQWMAQDGTYLYAGDSTSGKINLFDGGNNWHSEFTANTPNPTGLAGLVFDGSAVNACVATSSPTGTQGICQFFSFGTGSFFVGGNILKYAPYVNLGIYTPTTNSLPTRGSFGESQFAFIDLIGSVGSVLPVASNALINIGASVQSIISSYSNNSPPNNVNVLSIVGGDTFQIGDNSFCAGIILETIGSITSFGGRVEVPTTVTSSSYNVLNTDRIIYFTGNSGTSINLPHATGSNRILTIITGPLTNNTGNTVLLVPNTGDRIGSDLANASWIMGTADANITIQDTAINTWSIVTRSFNNITFIANTTYQILASDDIVPCDSTSAGFTVTLTASPYIGEQHTVMDVTGAASTHNITVARNGHNINGSASNFTLAGAFAVQTFTFMGSTCGWFSVAGL